MLLKLRQWMRFIASLAAIAAAILLGEFVYRSVIVPALPGIDAVPPWMWIVADAPEFLAVWISGVGIRSWRAVALYAVGAAVVRNALMYAFAVTGQPGHLKAFEDPTFELAIGVPLWAGIYGVLLAAASERARKAAGRALRASANPG